MKLQLKYRLSTLLLAIRAMFHSFGMGREACANVASSVGTHADGILPNCVVEATFASRYLLAQKGSAANGIIVNVAATQPWGVCLDEPTYSASVTTKAAVAALGVASGTLKMVASGVLAAGASVYTDAGGKVTGTATAGCYKVGRAVTAAGADADVIEVAHHFPVPYSVPTVANATADRTVTALEATGGIVVSNLGASGAVTFALPAAVVGMRVSAAVRAAQELRLDPNGSETIALPSSGAQGSGGKYLTADAVGESVNLICLTAGTWDSLGYIGNWAAQG